MSRNSRLVLGFELDISISNIACLLNFARFYLGLEIKKTFAGIETTQVERGSYLLCTIHSCIFKTNEIPVLVLIAAKITITSEISNSILTDAESPDSLIRSNYLILF